MRRFRALWLCLALCALLSGCARMSLPRLALPRINLPRWASPSGEGARVREDALEAEVVSRGPDFSGVGDGALRVEYGAPDALGRTTAAFAILGRESLTDRDRPDMSALFPTGMHNAAYDFVRDRWVYNRCHLIGHQFGGASVPENLITGTHALNHTYMLPWENRVADFIRRTGIHVLYRVTPLYDGDDLVCGAVLLEAMSCDWRRQLRFAVRCPNAQPGVAIDYATGYTTLADDWSRGGMTAAPRRYVVNTRTRKFHLPGCEEAAKVAASRREEPFCDRAALLRQGLVPCGRCDP